ncbi:class I SAM-dependent DNA methyltransferase [Nocardia abscessus]|uniref:class I SAM-dependent DNA methyltransferase n=1 Tax=Nocardia abscessus TaxID=120957 RepID=UPI002454960B|nr:class I SAM-dependent DNA methyltransferase [Nocardia abscessus]
MTNLVWSIADLLRSDFRPSEYASIILPLTVLRRLESIRSGQGATLAELAAGPSVTVTALYDYLDTFPPDLRIPLEDFGFLASVHRFDDGSVLHQVVSRFAEIDLRRDAVPDAEMGCVFEELVRRYIELAADTSAEHSTPVDVADLAVQLLLAPDLPAVVTGATRTVLDPACGTGGFLNQLTELATTKSPALGFRIAGQELDPESLALCRMRMMMQGRDPSGIELGNSLSNDRHPTQTYDYLIAAPPLGLDWKNSADAVRQEHETLGTAGRFGAGLPSLSDSSLLFLQHMLSKVKPTGSRLVALFNESAMRRGGAGSGESNIRRHVIENDWLESIVALPDSLLYATPIPTYLWTLTNRKTADQRGKVVLIDARDHSQPMRRPQGSKRRNITRAQINELVDTFVNYDAIASDSEHPMHGRVSVVGNEDFGHHQVTIESPLRLRFELTEAALERLARTRSVRDVADINEVLAPLRNNIGSVWQDKQSALAGIEQLMLDAGNDLRTDLRFRRAIIEAISSPDPEGQIQRIRGEALPDPRQRRTLRLPLDTDLDEYMRNTVLVRSPDAWYDPAKTAVGYEISPTLFFRPTLDTRYVPLHEVADIRRTEWIADESQTRHLRTRDLYSAESADELPDLNGTRLPLSFCTGGDLVGNPGNWRVLPMQFGEAATTMSVLRPYGPYGHGLCEWMNSQTDQTTFGHARRQPSHDLPVPIDLIADSLLDGLLETVENSRRLVREVVPRLLPNLFTEAKRDTRFFRENARAITTQAIVVGDVVSAVVDPVWRAEWTYPFHVAALARRYRLSNQPAERKDALLKLGEGVARTVGILALTEFMEGNRLPKKMANRIGSGATFGNWVDILRDFRDETSPPRMRELTELRDNARLFESLRTIQGFRNSAAHAHGIRAMHQLEEEVEELQPLVLSALTAANWLSTIEWNWITDCKYLAESSYLLIGHRLRGSHPQWEPFEQSSTYPLRPKRLYTGTDILAGAGQPLDLTPLATVRLCSDCNTNELFLIDKIHKENITLRSLEEHSIITVQLTAP